ncbi:hypothetical protein Peur_014730 [Populus x canadensis]|uniref:agamous-like MADS-box protein AGL75 n=1 Tax=Populus nigra TaxID=3691 RepID=UPI002B26F7E3|nr:agamous-like MADS-box protein AGL75 [Populus nigra]
MADIGTTRMPNHQRKKILNRDQASHAMSFSKRTKTLKKKAHELQTLCDVKICMVCFGPDSTVQTWPEGAVEVKDAIMSYKGLGDRKKYESSLLGYLHDKKMKLEVKKRKVMKKKVNKELIVKWSDHVDGLSDDALRDTVNTLESRLFDLKEKIKLCMQRDKVEAIQDHVDMEFEMDGSSVPSSAAGATAWPAEVMDTNINVVETVGNNDKDAASTSFEMPPLPKDSRDWMENLRNWMENDEAYQHGFENDDWFNEWEAWEAKQQYDDCQL